MSGPGNIEDWVYDDRKHKGFGIIIEDKLIELKSITEGQLEDIILVLQQKKSLIQIEKNIKKSVDSIYEKITGKNDKSIDI